MIEALAALATGPRSLLMAGSGGDAAGQWEASGYTVTRLDIDPATKPDVVASMTDVGDIGPFDTVFCCHALEHLYPHEVPQALGEFWRVLRPGGVVLVVVPDLDGVAATDEALGMAPNGCAVTGLHLYYGDAALIPTQPYMAHHCGFVSSTLSAAMAAAGFEVRTERQGGYNLMGIGVKR